MVSYELPLYGLQPVAKERPRFTRCGIVYTPKKTAIYEQTIRRAYMGDKFDGAIWLDAVFGIPIPKSAPKKLRERMLSGEVRPTKKPDTDNLLKAVCDALNGVAFEDDKQIVRISGEKIYAAEPFVKIRITEI